MPPQMMQQMMPPGMQQQPPSPKINEIPPSPVMSDTEQEVRKVNLNNSRAEMRGPASLDSLLGGMNETDSLASVSRKKTNRGRRPKNEINLG